MMDEDGSSLQQLAIWKDKYNRIAEQHAILLNQNQELEDRLLNVVDKIERDKSLLSDEIDHLAEKLACATNTIDFMKSECARYKSDCMLAVHLLQCQPSFYTSQHLHSLPQELRQKLCSETPAGNDGSSFGSRSGSRERKTVNFSASAMTFPPTAIFLQSNEPAADEIPPDEPESRHDVRDVFVKKILMAPEYQTEKLAQCPKCGFAVIKYDRCTQTVGDSSYLSNSRSAPHLHALDDGHDLDEENTRRKRRSTNTSGDLLIDLADNDRVSSPNSTTYALQGATNPTATTQRQVQFNVSPGVHHYQRYPNSDAKSTVQQPNLDLQRYEKSQKQEFTVIALADDP